MKSIIKTLIIAILGIVMISCGPTIRDKQNIISSYQSYTNLYEYDMTYTTEESSASFEAQQLSMKIYVMAFDKYEAEKLFDNYINNAKSINLLNYTSKVIKLSRYQNYVNR